MLNITNELKKKLLVARSAGEVASLLKESGMDDSIAEQLWKEINAHRDDRELSPDELEALSGGADRDWAKDGCASTVEAESWCRSNDWCKYWDVTYDNEPVGAHCPVCGTYLYIEKTEYDPATGDDISYYRCKNCGYSEVY